MRSDNRLKEEIYTKKRESLFFVQKREREGREVYLRVNKEGVYLTIKVTTNCTRVFYGKKGWKEENSIRLLVSE